MPPGDAGFVPAFFIARKGLPPPGGHEAEVGGGQGARRCGLAVGQAAGKSRSASLRQRGKSPHAGQV